MMLVALQFLLLLKKLGFWGFGFFVFHIYLIGSGATHQGMWKLVLSFHRVDLGNRRPPDSAAGSFTMENPVTSLRSPLSSGQDTSPTKWFY